MFIDGDKSEGLAILSNLNISKSTCWFNWKRGGFRKKCLCQPQALGCASQRRPLALDCRGQQRVKIQLGEQATREPSQGLIFGARLAKRKLTRASDLSCKLTSWVEKDAFSPQADYLVYKT